MTALFTRINDAWNGLPETLKKALRDGGTAFVVTFTAALSLLNLVFPHTLDQAKAEALLVASGAVIPAVFAIIAILRVELLPAALNWLLGLRFSKTATLR
jgi:hypothetical protein